MMRGSERRRAVAVELVEVPAVRREKWRYEGEGWRWGGRSVAAAGAAALRRSLGPARRHKLSRSHAP